LEQNATFSQEVMKRSVITSALLHALKIAYYAFEQCSKIQPVVKIKNYSPQIKIIEN